MRYLLSACVVLSLVAVTAGCKSSNREAAFIPPEPVVADTGPSEPTGPEPAVGPVYTGPDTTAPASPTGPVVDVGTTDYDAGTPDAPDTTGRTYVVKKGDTLYALARRFYRDHTKWRLIYQANTDTLADPNYVRVGQVLKIPPDK